MSRKTVVLADAGYTICRLVELSFREEKDVELIVFEDSHNLQKKLLELKPEIVLVDIKFPGFNGYDVCRFINSTENLKKTKVFLLKGGFEPVDENLLKGLRFVDIIIKPFDISALVSRIKELLALIPATAPSSDQVEISSHIEESPFADEEISFEDIKEEIMFNDIKPIEIEGLYPEEEILPSEEETQSSQPNKKKSPQAPPEKNIFVSYSHKDSEWLDKLKIMLSPLMRKGSLNIWDDTRIKMGKKWKTEIRKALDKADIAILLVSPYFLASDFIVTHELPPLLESAKKKGLKIIWIAVSASLYKKTEISEYQAANDPNEPLDTLPPPRQNQVLVKICEDIESVLFK